MVEITKSEDTLRPTLMKTIVSYSYIFLALEIGRIMVMIDDSIIQNTSMSSIS